MDQAPQSSDRLRQRPRLRALSLLLSLSLLGGSFSSSPSGFLLPRPAEAAKAKAKAKGPKGGKPGAKPAAPPPEEPAAPVEKTPSPPPDAAPSSAPAAPAAPSTPSAPSPAVAKPKLPKKVRLRVTIIPLTSQAISDQTQVGVQRELAESLKRNSHLDFKDLDVRLAEFAQEMPFEQVELARTTFEQGREAMYKLELDSALTQLNDAVDQFIAVLPYIKKQELADAMMALATVQQQKGATRAMQATLKRLLVWRPNYELDTKQFPEQLQEPLESMRQSVSQLKQAQIKVESDPSGAQVFVDGEYVGVAPLTTQNLYVGEHYITFKKLGYKRGLRVAQVTPTGGGLVQGKLQRSPKYLLVEQALERVTKSIGGSPLDKVVDNLRETLFLDHAVFIRSQKGKDDNEVQLTGFLYDLRSRGLLAKEVETVALTSGLPTAGTLTGLAERLYAKVDYEGGPTPPADIAPPVATSTPLYKRWWFWTALGVIAAGGASALAVGLTSRTPSCPDGSVCTGSISYALTVPF